MHQDLKQTIKEDVIQSQFQLSQFTKLLVLLMFVHKALKKSELKIVLHYQSQLFVQLDLALMEMENVFQIQLLF